MTLSQRIKNSQDTVKESSHPLALVRKLLPITGKGTKRVGNVMLRISTSQTKLSIIGQYNHLS